MTRNAVWALSNLCRGKNPPPAFEKVSLCLRQSTLGVCYMTILDLERLDCVHDPPLQRDCLHLMSVRILSVAVLGSDTHDTFSPNQITVFAAPFRSMPPIDTRT